MSDHALLQFTGLCASLSLLAFGGGKSMIPDLHNEVVTDHKWMGEERFMDLFAISQTAPGPSTLFVSLLGYQIAGWAGFLAAAVAMLLPEFIMVYLVSYAWTRIREKPLSHFIAEGLAPVTLGLLLSGALVVAKGAIHGLGGALIAIVSLVLFSLTKVNPLLVMGIAALVGWLGWV